MACSPDDVAPESSALRGGFVVGTMPSLLKNRSVPAMSTMRTMSAKMYFICVSFTYRAAEN